MTGVRVTHTIGDLASDLRTIAAKAKPTMARVVAANAREGNKLARQYARRGAGPHGLNYFKRISAERITPLSWEYGPAGIPKSNFVGVGFRHGHNTDLARSADVVGPKLAEDVLDEVDGLFWPGA